MSEQGCISLAEALEILGPFVAGRTRDNENWYLYGNTKATERAIKAEAHRVCVQRNTRSY